MGGGQAVSYGLAREVCSALSAVLLRGLEADPTSILAHQVAAILKEFHKFFDTVGHAVLASQAQSRSTRRRSSSWRFRELPQAAPLRTGRRRLRLCHQFRR